MFKNTYGEYWYFIISYYTKSSFYYYILGSYSVLSIACYEHNEFTIVIDSGSILLRMIVWTFTKWVRYYFLLFFIICNLSMLNFFYFIFSLINTEWWRNRDILVINDWTDWTDLETICSYWLKLSILLLVLLFALFLVLFLVLI